MSTFGDPIWEAEEVRRDTEDKLLQARQRETLMAMQQLVDCPGWATYKRLLQDKARLERAEQDKATTAHDFARRVGYGEALADAAAMPDDTITMLSQILAGV